MKIEDSMRTRIAEMPEHVMMQVAGAEVLIYFGEEPEPQLKEKLIEILTSAYEHRLIPECENMAAI